MKILCLYLGGHPSCLGGIETFERNLKKMYSDTVSFFTLKSKKPKYYDVDDVTEFETTNIGYKVLKIFLKEYKAIRFFLNTSDEKIYIINNPRELDCINKKSKKILVQHFNYEAYRFHRKKRLVNRCRKYLNYFVFLSEYDKEKFIKELNFPREKSIVIRHTCNMEILKTEKIKNKNLIMICRLENNQKRLDLAIKTMKKLQDFTLNIYGGGQDREYLENLIKENNLKNVILHGGTSQVKEKLDENGIFVMTSDYEGYPITSIEAMRRGLPIILRNTFDSAPDIVQDNGILLDKEWNEDKFVETIRKVYDNYDYYSENSIKLGKRHDFEIIKKEWDKLFKSIN